MKKSWKSRATLVSTGIVVLLSAMALSSNTVALAQPAPSPQTSEVEQAAQTTEDPPKVSVHLGDSFASGQGAGSNRPEDQSVYEAGTTESGDECFRARRTSYGPIVAAMKGYTLINVSCGGATTESITSITRRTVTDGRTVSIAPQIDSVRPDASLVTITIGGNDAQFVPFVACVVGNPISSGNPCTEASPETLATRAAITTLRSKVANVLTVIQSKAPNAKIVITGYPQVVGSGIGCQPWLTASENILANDVNRSVNAEIQKAAVDTGATYVDVFQKGTFGTNSHACSLNPPQQFYPGHPTRKLNGIVALFQPANFHPNDLGQRAIAQLVGAAA